jgi:hypothetical protein
MIRENSMARQPRESDAGAEDALEAAYKRLERALALLETKVEASKSNVNDGAGSVFDFDRSKLANELDEARAKQRDLETAGREASEALGRAISEIRGALQQAEG